MKNNLQKSCFKLNIGISFQVFSCYFQDKKDLKIFLTALSREKQEKFLRLSKFYNDFVYNSLIKDESTKKYFSLIMIFSLIEATMSKEEHLTFDEYLFKNFEPTSDEEDLKRIQDKYFDEFGVRRQVKKFFDDHVDEECKKLFANAINFNSGNKQKALSVDENVKKNIDLFYQWRSNFVHNAEIPVAFRESSFCEVKKNIITTAYAREDFEKLFEHGFLRYFGYTKKFEHKNTEEKIERYNNHTIHEVSKKITQSINKFLKLKN